MRVIGARWIYNRLLELNIDLGELFEPVRRTIEPFVDNYQCILERFDPFLQRIEPYARSIIDFFRP